MVEIYKRYTTALDDVAIIRALSQSQAPETGMLTVPSPQAQRAMKSVRALAIELAEMGAVDEAEDIASQVRRTLVEGGHFDWLFYMSMAGTDTEEGDRRA